MSVFAKTFNKVFDVLRIDSAKTGIHAGGALIEGMAFILSPAAPAMSKFLKLMFDEASKQAEGIAKAVEPIVAIGESFNASRQFTDP